jgi:hypothetical protein
VLVGLGALLAAVAGLGALRLLGPDGPALADAPPARPSDPPTSSPGTGYAFTQTTSDGSPVAFDPCAGPLRLLHNPASAPYAAAADLRALAERLTGGLGREVRFAGRTARTREAFEADPPDRPTILVTWVPDRRDLDEGSGPNAVGEGGFIARGDTITAGTITLVADADLVPGLGPGSWGALLLHEGGHAVGLAHVDDPTQAMNPQLVPDRPARWGAGDRAGLALLGGPCPG